MDLFIIIKIIELLEEYIIKIVKMGGCCVKPSPKDQDDCFTRGHKKKI